MKLSTLRTALSCVLLVAARLSASQAVSLTLSSVETHADNRMELILLLNATLSSAPVALQWTFKLPPGLDIVRIEAGRAVKTAGKTLVCNGAKCMVYGLNRKKIPNGPIAVLNIKIDQALAGGGLKYQAHGRAGTTNSKIRVADVVAVSLDAKVIPLGPPSARPMR